MTVQARRMLDFTESATEHSGEQIRLHVRSRLEKLIASLKVDGMRVLVEAE